jgi:hypothetical protein
VGITDRALCPLMFRSEAKVCIPLDAHPCLSKTYLSRHAIPNPDGEPW